MELDGIQITHIEKSPSCARCSKQNELPAEGSDTIFADLCAAYKELSKLEQEELSNLIFHHSCKHFMVTSVYHQTKVNSKIEQENLHVYQPLIRTNPVDRLKALWVSIDIVTEIIGLPNPEQLNLLKEFVEFCTQKKFTFHHKWQVGDVFI